MVDDSRYPPPGHLADKPIEFSPELKKQIEDMLWIPCCHVTGMHDPLHYSKSQICDFQLANAFRRFCQELGINPVTKSKDDCYWCNSAARAEKERQGEGVWLFQP